MRGWWNKRKRRRAEKLASERAEWEREWTRQASHNSAAAFALFRRVGEPLVQAGVAEFTWDEQHRTMGLVTTDTGTVVVLLQVLWPSWSECARRLPRPAHSYRARRWPRGGRADLRSHHARVVPGRRRRRRLYGVGRQVGGVPARCGSNPLSESVSARRPTRRNSVRRSSEQIRCNGTRRVGLPRRRWACAFLSIAGVRAHRAVVRRRVGLSTPAAAGHSAQ